MEAEGLAARDTNFLGLDASSDPYVEGRLAAMQKIRKNRDRCLKNANDFSNDGVLALGATEYVPQTLSPKWNESFKTKIPIDELDPTFAHFRLTIMDRDDRTKDDLMGEIKLPLEHLVRKVSPNNPSVSATEWHDVPPDSAMGELATGRVKCKVSIKLLMAE